MGWEPSSYPQVRSVSRNRDRSCLEMFQHQVLAKALTLHSVPIQFHGAALLGGIIGVSGRETNCVR